MAKHPRAPWSLWLSLSSPGVSKVSQSGSMASKSLDQTVAGTQKWENVFTHSAGGKQKSFQEGWPRGRASSAAALQSGTAKAG